MSTPVILREFSFFRDFRQIQWGATIWYNLLRSFCAGVTLCVLMLILQKGSGELMSTLAMPIAWPIGYFLIFIPIGIIFGVLNGIPYMNWCAALIALIAVSVGDPMVCILHKIFPKLVPVDSPPLFSLYIVFWVLDAPEVSVSN